MNSYKLAIDPTFSINPYLFISSMDIYAYVLCDVEKRGCVSHQNSWVAFLDALMHVMIVAEHTERALRVPTRIKEICITPLRLAQNRQG